jgi:hypothetical protein
VLGQTRLEEVRRLKDVTIGGDDKGLVRHVLSLPAAIHLPGRDSKGRTTRDRAKLGPQE